MPMESAHKSSGHHSPTFLSPGSTFEFSPSKDEQARYDSPEFWPAAGRASTASRRSGYQGGSSGKQKAGSRGTRQRSVSCGGAPDDATAITGRVGDFTLKQRVPHTDASHPSSRGKQRNRGPKVTHGSPSAASSLRRAVSEDGGAHGPSLPSRERRRSTDREVADKISLAMGTVTAAMAASAAALGCAGSPDQVVQRTWEWLAEQPEDAAELAQLLYEATPRLGVAAAGSSTGRRTLKGTRKTPSGREASLVDRLQEAQPVPTGAGCVRWETLSQVCPSEFLREENEEAAHFADTQAMHNRPHSADAIHAMSSPQPSPRGDVVEVNSGGQVLLCLLGSVPGAEEALVIKFHTSRLLTQAEQFASELTRHLGVPSPPCRILRPQGSTSEEWQAARAAASSLGEGGSALEEPLGRASSCLVMDYVPGPAFVDAQEPFLEHNAHRTAADLARLLMVDMLLGNADRLACRSLGWRGNPQNLRFCTRGPLAGRLVAIDAIVQRRPPGGLRCQEDAACSRLVELALNDKGFAARVLAEALGPCHWAGEAMQGQAVVDAFQASLRSSLQAVLHVKGLLEMMFGVISGWIEAFIADMESLEGGDGWQTPPQLSPRSPTPAAPASHSPPGNRWGADAAELHLSTTQKIKNIGREARRNELIRERLAAWKTTMREKGEELHRAVEDWQAKSGASGLCMTTGFLDGTQPVVDIYELKVRLEHMLSRLRALQDAAASARPTHLLPHLWLSGAVEAASLHLLRHLGITHLLNATEDLLLPDKAAGFQCLRCALRDEPEVDVSSHFSRALAFIAAAQKAGGSVLVHCHEGVSRSVTLVLAHLMKSKGWTLKRALDFVTVARPQANPNAGFMAHLLQLEQQLHGTRSVQVRSSKPQPRVCPVCQEKVGVSAQSLALHMRKAHPS